MIESQTMVTNKVWMVFVEGKDLPRHKHNDRASAEAEAIRLARKEPGKTVHVMVSEGAFVVPEVQPTRVYTIEPSVGGSCGMAFESSGIPSFRAGTLHSVTGPGAAESLKKGPLYPYTY